MRNIVLTFINVLYSLLYEDCMRTIPSREKNETSLPGSFVFFGNCRMVNSISCAQTLSRMALLGLGWPRGVSSSSSGCTSSEMTEVKRETVSHLSSN